MRPARAIGMDRVNEKFSEVPAVPAEKLTRKMGQKWPCRLNRANVPADCQLIEFKLMSPDTGSTLKVPVVTVVSCPPTGPTAIEYEQALLQGVATSPTVGAPVVPAAQAQSTV